MQLKFPKIETHVPLFKHGSIEHGSEVFSFVTIKFVALGWIAFFISSIYKIKKLEWVIQIIFLVLIIRKFKKKRT